ncbi:MAG: hypothetical protein HN981_02550 [Candidatus Pacebacteria bacterium]|nr:hypothetical protein [Candidatus Paceibacterota bacterium]MBT4652629.1 hypothetical protein [Candidatus Paceibacterota bacterium]MBT6756456.1 hypothetical protein [Candidatus Paceibacterota bacterium]MBT6921250.1 hypothetical protein [Candidatus Paceibacterota bacterium]
MNIKKEIKKATSLKNIFNFVFLVILSIFILKTPSNVFAQNTGLPDPDTFEVTGDVLDNFDPLLTENSPHAAELSTPGGIISRALTFAFPLAGLVLFVMIVAGGLQILGGAANSKSLQEGQKRVTMAIVGFLVLFSSYWITQILEAIFGISIL